MTETTQKNKSVFFTKIQARTYDEFIWYDMPCDQDPDESKNFKIKLGLRRIQFYSTLINKTYCSKKKN